MWTVCKFLLRVETAYCRVLLAVLSGKGSVVDIEAKCDGGTAIIHFLFVQWTSLFWWVVLVISHEWPNCLVYRPPLMPRKESSLVLLLPTSTELFHFRLFIKFLALLGLSDMTLGSFVSRTGLSGTVLSGTTSSGSTVRPLALGRLWAAVWPLEFLSDA